MEYQIKAQLFHVLSFLACIYYLDIFNQKWSFLHKEWEDFDQTC